MNGSSSTTTAAAATSAHSNRWQLLTFTLLVALGATFGTFLRAALSSAFPHEAGAWPWATFLINITGSFILGMLLESLVLTGIDSGWRRTVRLMCGTGIMGGYTTYSTFILEIEKTTSAGAAALGFGYAVVSLVLGTAAAMLGMMLAGMLFKRPQVRSEKEGRK